MATRGALGVRINDGQRDRTVTKYTRGLKFSKQSDGGHRDLSCALTLPLNTFSDLGPSDRIFVSDARHGGPIWDGYLDAPTPTRGPRGQQFELGALGGMSRAADETRALVYVDRDQSTYMRDPNDAANGSADSAPDEFYGPTLKRVRTLLSAGTPVTAGSTASGVYSGLNGTDMFLGGVNVPYFYSGKGQDTGGNGYAEDFAVPAGIVYTRTMRDNAGSLTLFVRESGAAPNGGGEIPAGNRPFGFRTRRTGGATNIVDDTTWTNWVDVSVLGQRMNRYGNLLVAQAGLRSASNVLASEVVEDLLGRLMTFCDPNASTVGITTALIDQLTYMDGVTSQVVLDDLADYEPGMLWEVLHATDTTLAARHVFNYRPWPTTPRYEIGSRDGYSEPGSDVDLANRIAVTWNDPLGMPQVEVVTADSTQYPALAALEATGRVRDAEPVTLPDGQGSEANAIALGAAILADKNSLGTSARAVIRRPIRDLYTGRMVMPWEIEPGHLARVRETGADLRLTEMEYDDDDVATTVSLGYPSLTRDQRLAAVGRAA